MSSIGARAVRRVKGWVHRLAARRALATRRHATLAAGAVIAAVCGLTVIARAESSGGAPTSEPEWLPERDGESPVLVFPPKGAAAGPRPVTVMLHGMCDVPERECPYFANVATRTSWLVCPRGPLTCSSGGATWAASGRTEVVESAIARLVALHPSEVDSERARTLIGFSLGAFVAMDLANRAPTRWSRVVLLAAKIAPAPRQLLRGSTRFVFGAGDLDLSQSHMESAARWLRRDGIDATFLSLGRVGHRFADDMDGWLRIALE